MFLINKKEDLKRAIDKLDSGNTYQALDIINKHLRDIIETANPTLKRITDSMIEYRQQLEDARELLEKSTKETISIEANMIEEAKNKINNAVKKLGILDECGKIMVKCKEKLH